MHHNVLFFLKSKTKVKFLYDNVSLKDGMALMNEHGYTAMPVIDLEGKYVGTITEGDFLWFIRSNYDHICQKDFEQMPIGSLIRRGFMPAVSIDTPLKQLFEASLKQNFVPVVDDRKIFIGIVTRQQIISYLMKNTEEEIYPNETVESFSVYLRP